ncbi:hypothetical protein GCM10020256_74280 [Streptomyces thermocoprophilus]
MLDTTADGAPRHTPSATGARHEPTTGYLDLHARQYDTTTGRFDRPDLSRGAPAARTSPRTPTPTTSPPL